MSDWHLAQLNIAHLLAPIDSPALEGFVSQLDRINALAEASPGFVWRLETDVRDDELETNPFGDEVIVNLSVWESVETLFDYVYRTAHTDVMKQRKQWFHRASGQYTVLWWIPVGHQPSELEAKERLELLEQQGPNQNAFTFKQRYSKPEH